MARLAAKADDASMDTVTADKRTARTTLEEATVEDAMTTGLISCSPDTPLSEVALTMASHNIHAVFVFDYEQETGGTAELWGLVSDLDLVAAACADVDSITARESSVTPLVSIRIDDCLEHAAQRMAETGVSHLAVLEAATGRPVGVLSTLDVVRYVAGTVRGGRFTS
jgi:CBS domain-containing protein